jgi:hypothetical protein
MGVDKNYKSLYFIRDWIGCLFWLGSILLGFGSEGLLLRGGFLGIRVVGISLGLGAGEGDNGVHLELRLEHLHQLILLTLPAHLTLGVMRGQTHIGLLPTLLVDTLHLLQLLLQLGVLGLNLLALPVTSPRFLGRDARQECGLILHPNPSRVFGDGLAHEFVMFLSAGEFLLLVEDLGVEFDLLVLVGEVEVLAGGAGDPLLAVQLLDGLQPSLVALVVVLDPVQLHYPHFIYYICHQTDSRCGRVLMQDIG